MPQLRRLPRRRKGTAFVLSGGGNLGALQVGMLRALVERGISPDVIYGCSVGAMNGAAFAAAPDRDGVERLAHRWREMTIDAPTVMPSSFIPNPVQLVRKGESLHRNDGLRATIESFLGDVGRFDELTVAFECVATDVDRGVEQWFHEGPLVEPVLASAALPAVYPFVTIDGRRYVDGGVVDNVPIERAVEAGMRTVYVLHCGIHGRPNPAVHRPIDAALIAYWISRNHRFAHDLARVPDRVNVVVLPTGARPEIRFDDFSRTAELIEQSYTLATEYLDELDRTAEDDAQELGDRLAQDVRRVVDELRGRVTNRT